MQPFCVARRACVRVSNSPASVLALEGQHHSEEYLHLDQWVVLIGAIDVRIRQSDATLSEGEIEDEDAIYEAPQTLQ